MASLGRRIPCFLVEHGASPHPLIRSTPAPYVYAGVLVNGLETSVEFLVDTGSDMTLLSPSAAFAALGWQYFELDFQDPSLRIEMVGVGEAGAIVRTVDLVFQDDGGEDLVIATAVGIAEPKPAVPGWHGNWVTPSMLGRDVLRRFDFSLGYHPPAGTLTEAVPSP